MIPEEQLIQGYLENSLSKAEADALRQWLAEDTAHVDRLALESFLQARNLSGQSATRPTVVRAGNKKVQQSPVLGFLHRLMHVTGDTPLATALMWMVMVLCSGMMLTMFVFVWVMLHSIGVYDNAPEVAQQPASLPSPVLGRGAGGEGIPHPSTVARLIHAANCRWAAGSNAPQEGDDLESGRKLVLKSGLAELMFTSGARAVLQGPATLEVASKTTAFLQRGRVSVTVEEPEARGFEIHTPGMKITDFGTEFGVLVAKDGMQEVHVFRGKVAAEEVDSTQWAVDRGKDGLPSPSSVPRGGRGAGGEGGLSSTDHQPLTTNHPAPLLLSAHEAIRVASPSELANGDKPIEHIAADDKQFVRVEQMPAIVVESSPEFQRWKKFSDELCQRKDLVAYYDFQSDDGKPSVLRNRAASGAALDGRIEGAKWDEGHLPGKKALLFSDVNDRVRLNIPGHFNSRTIPKSVMLACDLAQRGIAMKSTSSETIMPLRSTPQ